MPEIVAHGSGFCQKKWLLHYGMNTILGSPELSRQVCLARMACILAAQAHFPTYRSGSEGFWTTMVYHYGVCMGETVYSVDFS